jgi:D-lactate dehydrogenase
VSRQSAHPQLCPTRLTQASQRRIRLAAGDGAIALPASPRVVVFSAAPYVLEYLEAPLQEAFPGTRFVEARLSKSSAQLAQGAEVACLFVNDDCNADVCAQLRAAGVRLIAMRCAGFDRVDLAAAAAEGLTVVRVPSYSPHAVAEQAVALTLCLNRNLHKAYARVREGNFTLNGLTGFNMHGKTVGIVGTGQIGTITGGIFARGFGCRVLGYDLYPSPEFTALGGTYCTLPELLSQSDVISLHAPLTKSTLHLIGAEQIAQMKRGAFVINTSRGGLVDTRAMIDGLASGAVGALGMDVYEREGRLFFKDFSSMTRSKRLRDWDEEMAVLLSIPTVIVTPHSAFLTTEALTSIAATTVDNISAWARGEELTNVVR